MGEGYDSMSCLQHHLRQYSHWGKLLVDPKEGIFSEIFWRGYLPRHTEYLTLHFWKCYQRLVEGKKKEGN